MLAKDCWDAYNKGGYAEEMEWPELCMNCKGDEDIDAEFDGVAQAVAGKAERDVNQQEVAMVSRTGSKVTSKYVLIKGTALEKLTGGCASSSLGIQMSSVPGEDDTASQLGLLVRAEELKQRPEVF